MKNRIATVAVLALILLTFSCGRSATRTETPGTSAPANPAGAVVDPRNPGKGISASLLARSTDFFLVAVDEQGRFDAARTASLAVAQADSGGAVNVTVSAAKDIASSLYLYVIYPPKALRPAAATPLGALADGGKCIFLSMDKFAGSLALGAAFIGRPSKIAAGTQVFSVSFARTMGVPGAKVPAAAPPPMGADDKVTTGVGEYQGVGVGMKVTFAEVNVGDYNNNGMVEISDLGPVAAFYANGIKYPLFNNFMHNAQIDIVDGNGDGDISIADLAPMAAHYGTELAGYRIYAGHWVTSSIVWQPTYLPSNTTPGDTMTVRRPGVPGNTRVHYTYNDNLTWLP